MVLSHPEILLHNNPAELGARQRVRKRDVSLQARTHEGIEAWDTFQTLVATAKKLGVNLFSFFFDRLTHTFALPSLATLIEQRAASLALGSSWKRAPSPSLLPVSQACSANQLVPHALFTLFVERVNGLLPCLPPPQLLR